MLYDDKNGAVPVVCPTCKQRGLASTMDPMGDWFAPPQFDFGTALRLMKAGRKVSRAKWGSGRWLEFGGKVCTIWECTSDSQEVWQPYEWLIFHDDLIAEDWELVP